MSSVRRLSRREEPAATPIRSNGESGQVLILAVLAITVIFAIAVIVVDFGMWFSGRESVVNALDQGTMAGSLSLPKDGATAAAVARQYVQENDPEITDINISFRCVVGDRNGDGVPDSGDIPAVCPQLTAGAFTCIDDICYANCSFSSSTAKCNTIVVKGSKDVPFGFGPIFGLDSGATAGFTSAACRGACGGPPTLPLDLVTIIDRTGSMSTTELNNAKNAAKSILQLFNPAIQHVAQGVLGPSSTTTLCTGSYAGGLGRATDSGGTWLPVELSDDYQNPNGSLNTSSLLVKTINCLDNSSVGTDLGTPMKTATDYLPASGRPDVKKGIILLTDGAANAMPSEDTGYRSPTANLAASGGDGNGFEVNPTNAYADDTSYAVDTDSGTGTSTSCGSSQKDRHDFYNYGISVPGGNTILGIEVRLDAWMDNASSSTRRMCVQLSWDGGTSWTTASSDYQVNNLTTSQRTYTLGGNGDTWGHTWTPSELSNANFRVRITNVSDKSSPYTRDFYLDWAAVRVYHTPYPGPCAYAAQQAAAAKALDPPIEIFTIGFGVENMDCDSSSGERSSSPYFNRPVTQLLADMATDSADDHGHCASSMAIRDENADGDHFLCEAKTADLEPVFRAAAEALASGSRLVSIPY